MTIPNHGGWRPWGSIGDLTRKLVNRRKGSCVRCGAGLDKGRKYCKPCVADVHAELVQKRKARRRAERKARS